MEVHMIGNNTKESSRLKSVVSNYCKDHNLSFNYRSYEDLSYTMKELLASREARSIPIFIITREEKNILITPGEGIFLELKRL